MGDPAQIAGVVLAGGRSSRMRRNKATLRVDGEPLWRRQEGVLRAAGAEPVLFALRPHQRSLGRPALEIRDTVEDAGPLAGIHAALAACAAPLLLVLAVDMPRIGPGWFKRLRAHCRDGCGAVVRGPHGFEPLAAIYPREALAEATRRLRRGEFAVHKLIAALVRVRRMKVVRLSAKDAAQAGNWNRPTDVLM